MLAVAPPRGAEHGDAGENYGGDNFSDEYGGGDLLEDIDFDDLFVGFDEADGLPDLEVDPNEIFADFPTSSQELSGSTEDEKHEFAGAPEEAAAENNSNSSGKGSKTAQAKKKVKVDWTPDLHRRFVQAVEQLGIEKAVPSKILEIMGVQGLTRHNIASHLQKYRSHRKHVLAREAEAANWSQRRRMYGGGAPAAAATKRITTSPWTMGFPSPAPPSAPMHHFRPLHVWGHPTADHAMMHMWPRPMVPSRSPMAPWGPTQDASFWHHPHHYARPGIPQIAACLPPPLQPTRVTGKPVAGIPPPPVMYKQDAAVSLPPAQLQMEHLPSNETIDAVLGDVLSKPWLPLPLGLKPPSTESVLGELQKQGISRVPPSCA